MEINCGSSKCPQFSSKCPQALLAHLQDFPCLLISLLKIFHLCSRSSNLFEDYPSFLKIFSPAVLYPSLPNPYHFLAHIPEFFHTLQSFYMLFLTHLYFHMLSCTILFSPVLSCTQSNSPVLSCNILYSPVLSCTLMYRETKK